MRGSTPSSFALGARISIRVAFVFRRLQMPAWPYSVDRVTTIRSRELGEALRIVMEEAGFKARQLARQLGWAESKMSRLLSGQVTVSELDIVAFLALCHVTGAERQRILRLARKQDGLGWLQQHHSKLPEQLKTLIDHETKAVRITAFEALIVPGLLQTSEYARGLIERIANVPPEEVESRVAARLARQNIYSESSHPHFMFFIHESALRLPVGGAEVMSNQLHELLRLAVRSYIEIRVVPTAFGAHAGTAGSCTLMEFDRFKPVVYIEEETAGHFLEEPAEIAAYRRIFSALTDYALDEGESKSLIAALAVEQYGEGSDDRD